MVTRDRRKLKIYLCAKFGCFAPELVGGVGRQRNNHTRISCSESRVQVEKNLERWRYDVGRGGSKREDMCE